VVERTRLRWPRRSEVDDTGPDAVQQEPINNHMTILDLSFCVGGAENDALIERSK
jgi:hypothetical protein